MQTAFFYAASRCHLATCRLLVERQADPWHVDTSGRSPLDLVTAKRARVQTEDARRPRGINPASQIIAFLESLPGRPSAGSSALVATRRPLLEDSPPIAQRTRGAKRRQAEALMAAAAP